MKYLIISFKSRNSTYEFNKLLKLRGVFSSVINTPKRISSSCSLSVKSDYRNYTIILELIKTLKPTTLIGMFIVEESGFSQNIVRVI